MRPDRPSTHPARRYTQKEAAELLGLHPATLRRRELRGDVTFGVTRYGRKYLTGAQIDRIWEDLW